MRVALQCGAAGVCVCVRMGGGGEEALLLPLSRGDLLPHALGPLVDEALGLLG